MEGVDARRLDGTVAALESRVVRELRAHFGERLVTPGDDRYDQARRVWNGMIERRPALIVGCRTDEDVMVSVRFAYEHRLLLAVRGGGHNVAGFGTCDGGLVIDLSPMRGVRVDPRTQTVRVGAGATWAHVDRATEPAGLAVPGGIVSTTGVAGLTLGGGQGWLRRTVGMSCDNLLSAKVVTADGQLQEASEASNADLFWALRGGGGNFGVVTSFEFRAHRIGSTIAFAGPAYPLESASSVMPVVRAFAADAPDEVNLSTTWWTVPPVAVFPESLHGRNVIVVGAVYVGPPEVGERILQPLRTIEEPLLDLSATMPYPALQRMFDPFFPAGSLRYYWKSLYLAALADDAIRMVAEHVAARPSPLSMASIWALGGALDREDASAAAAGARGAPFLLEILANWSQAAESTANIGWAQEFFRAMKPFGTGRTNVNFPGFGDDHDFGRSAFGEQWARLLDVKRKYDPANLFRLNQNIAPDAAGRVLQAATGR